VSTVRCCLQVTEEFLVEHHMNYGLESSSGIRYDVQHQTYVQQRQGMTYKLDKQSQQWIPLESYTDEVNRIKYNFSSKHHTWIPEQSTYSARNDDGHEQTYVWLKEQLQWAVLSSVDGYTDHLTGMKYKWNNENQSWDNDGIEPIDNECSASKQASSIAASQSDAQNTKKKPSEGLSFE
jgi:hypothetical protein